MQKDNYTYGYDVEINALKKHYKTPDPICHFNGATRFKKVDLTKGLPPGLTIDSYKRAAFIEGAYLAVCLVRDAEKAHGNPIEIILKERI